ncbi:hypothetical protein AKO1_010324 [Acrasis kona]|uniref:Polymerase nucleotidyl transferase domain-containing protein n=1 Tax=Acrasis kona TaxID=1008807 RepID=A0AAW2ZP41_9EUKA
MLNTQILLDIMKFSQHERYNIYQSGSRVYGTHTPESDYDFFMVIENEYFEELDNKYGGSKSNDHNSIEYMWNNFHIVNALQPSELGYRCLYYDVEPNLSINVNLYSVTTFRTKLNVNWPQAMMCLYLSPEHLWRHDISGLDSENVPLYHRRIVLTTIGEAGKHFKLAQKSWQSNTENNHYSSKKYIVHTFRDILLGWQLIQHGRIVDYQAANDIFHEVMNCGETDWSYYQNEYYNRYQKLKKEFGQMVDEKMLVNWKPDHEFKSSVLCFLSRNNNQIDSLRLVLSLLVQSHPRIDGLYHVTRTQESPVESKVVVECGNGMIIDILNKKIVCAAMPMAMLLGSHCAPKLNFKENVDVIPELRSELSFYITLYCFRGGWYVTSKDHLDASNMVCGETFWDVIQVNNIDEQDQDKCFTFVFHLNGFRSALNKFYLFSTFNKSDNKYIECQPYTEKYGWALFQPSVNLLKSSSSVYEDEVVKVANADQAITYSNTLNPTLYSCLLLRSKTAILYIPCTQYEALKTLLDRSHKDSNVFGELMFDVVRTLSDDHITNTQLFKDPALASLYEHISSDYNSMCLRIDQMYTDVYSDNQKDFTLNIENYLNKDTALFKQSSQHSAVIINMLTQMKNGKQNSPSRTSQSKGPLTSKDFMVLSNIKNSFKVFNQINFD